MVGLQLLIRNLPATTLSTFLRPYILSFSSRTYASRAAPATETPPSAVASALPARGNLSSSSIFNQEAELADKKKPLRNPVTMAAKLDPQPMQRRRWERKMVIRDIQKRGRLTKTEKIKRTERELTVKSDLIRTSHKKLGPLARQIVGKGVEDALVQMDFSKKKNAVAIHDHIIGARDRAIVERGMGLGQAQGTKGKKAVIKLKDGTKHVVRDHTNMYIAQAWVGKGSYGQDISPRARGRIDRLRLPQTSESAYLLLLWYRLTDLRHIDCPERRGNVGSRTCRARSPAYEEEDLDTTS